MRSLQQSGHDGQDGASRQAARYRNDALWIEAVPVAELAASHDTPFYCYSRSAIALAHADLQAALHGLDPLICFAVKANGNLSVLRSLARLGAGADVVSGGELQRALSAGIAAERIVFSGVGKSDAEITQALACGIGHLNVESAAELDQITRLAKAGACRAPVLLRINPDIDPGTHAKIATGMADSKFGIPLAAIPALYREALSRPELALQGLALHIGSQILSPEPFAAAFAKLRQLVQDLRRAGLPVQRLDLGGGLGIDYATGLAPPLGQYAACLRSHLGDLDCALVIEPGRVLLARAGLLITRVIATKPAPRGWFVIVDAAMNDFMRPALYDAQHRILPVMGKRSSQTVLCHIAGPVCESSDIFARDLSLALPAAGALLAICDVGAYGASLASTYNARPLIAELLVDGAQHAVIRQRQSLTALLELERFPPWL